MPNIHTPSMDPYIHATRLYLGHVIDVITPFLYQLKFGGIFTRHPELVEHACRLRWTSEPSIFGDFRHVQRKTTLSRDGIAGQLVRSQSTVCLGRVYWLTRSRHRPYLTERGSASAPVNL